MRVMHQFRHTYIDFSSGLTTKWTGSEWNTIRSGRLMCLIWLLIDTGRILIDTLLDDERYEYST